MSVGKSGSAEAVHMEPKRGCLPRVRAHFRRFWWAHIIIFIACFLIILFPVIYVAYPKIAQHDVSKSTLEINGMKVTDPSPDSLHLKVDEKINTKSHYHPKFFPFDADVTLEGEKKPFITLRTPEFKSKDGVEFAIDQDLKLDNVDAFTTYATAVIKNEEIKLHVDGKAPLKQGGLPKTHADYNKIVTMKGLNGLKGLDVPSFNLASPTKDSPFNMRGKTYIPNPSVMTLTMGNITLQLSVDDTPMGTAHLDDVVIKPGNNTIDMTANVNQSLIVGLISGKSAKYKDGTIPLQVVANSTVYNGKELTYYSDALSSNKLTIQLNVLKALGSGLGGGS